MHPNVFLKTFWRMELKPQVFVAMSFDDRYLPRYRDIIAPAIQSVLVDGKALEPYRVDNSKTGDSIITDIEEGIAHSQMVVADVSSVGKDSVTGHPYRNGNVMYEVGIALACRQSSEVLLIRDDEDKFLFDVSTTPHLRLDFTKVEQARQRLHEELVARMKERDFMNDARVHRAIASLGVEEMMALKAIADMPPNTGYGRAHKGTVDFFGMASIPRLLDKQLIEVRGEFEEGGEPVYFPTPLGSVVAKLVKTNLRRFKATQRVENKK
ncbi:MAG: hypothetical protein V1809_10375 [Planctomycetota bacterium]